VYAESNQNPFTGFLHPIFFNQVTSEEHNKYIAWTFTAHAAFQTLMLLVILLFFGFLLSSMPPGRNPGAPPSAFIWTVMLFMTVFQSFLIIPSGIAAWGLFERKPWARMASIVAGVIAGMNLPLGTAAAVYSLWFFLGDRWKDIYGGSPVTAESDQGQLMSDMRDRWTGMRTDEKGEVTFHHVEPPDWR
jgi:hypothetical protein